MQRLEDGFFRLLSFSLFLCPTLDCFTLSIFYLSHMVAHTEYGGALVILCSHLPLSPYFKHTGSVPKILLWLNLVFICL